MILAPMILTILLFLALLSVLVFVHELGHFLVARACGMKVEEFGFGFPPRLFGVKKGDTTYSINWIPMGGFVRIKGENGTQGHDHDSFAAKKPWQRFLVLVAGVVMNILLAVLFFTCGYLAGLPSVIDASVPASARVTDVHTSVMEVVEGSPAARAGMVSGDTLLSINQQSLGTVEETRDYLLAHGTEGVDITYQSQDKTLKTVHVVAEMLPKTTVTGIGVGLVQTGRISFPWYLAFVHAVNTTIGLTLNIFSSFVQLFAGLLGGHGVSAELSGPVGIAVMTGQVASMGFVYLLQFGALLSLNLAVINILPFPALDGGRILFLLIETFRGKPAPQKWEMAVNNLGFLMLMGLIVFVTIKDVLNLVK